MYSIVQRQMTVMAFNAYRPSEENAIELLASEWEIDGVLSRPNRGAGFDATVYVNCNQIVVAFRGTDGPSLSDWDRKYLKGGARPTVNWINNA
jgi:hypothetical protein